METKAVVVAAVHGPRPFRRSTIPPDTAPKAAAPRRQDAPDSVLDVPREHERITRALRNDGMGREPGKAVPEQVLQSYCDALTAMAPRIALAWTWFGAPDSPRVQPQVVAGRASAYAQRLQIERTWLTARGPVFKAIDGRGSQIFNISPRSVYGPWREAAREHGIRSVIALRLSSSVDARRGLLVLYSDTERYFSFLGDGLFRSMAELFSLVLSNESAR